MKRLSVIAVLIIAALAALIATQPAQAGRPLQVLGGVLLRQHTGEAQVSLSTVDARRLPKLSPKAFRRGVILLDDSGRSLFIRGDAVVSLQLSYAQQFRLTNTAVAPDAQKGIRVVRVAHLTIGVFAGDDWAHWYDSDPVCNGQMGIEWCAGQWVQP
jgi:hypothetical protein